MQASYTSIVMVYHHSMHQYSYSYGGCKKWVSAQLDPLSLGGSMQGREKVDSSETTKPSFDSVAQSMKQFVALC